MKLECTCVHLVLLGLLGEWSVSETKRSPLTRCTKNGKLGGVFVSFEWNENALLVSFWRKIEFRFYLFFFFLAKTWQLSEIFGNALFQDLNVAPKYFFPRKIAHDHGLLLGQKKCKAFPPIWVFTGKFLKFDFWRISGVFKNVREAFGTFFDKDHFLLEDF